MTFDPASRTLPATLGGRPWPDPWASVLLFLVLWISRGIAVEVVRIRAHLPPCVPRRWIVSSRNVVQFLLLVGLVLIRAPKVMTYALSIAAVAVAIVVATREPILCLRAHSCAPPPAPSPWGTGSRSRASGARSWTTGCWPPRLRSRAELLSLHGKDGRRPEQPLRDDAGPHPDRNTLGVRRADAPVAMSQVAAIHLCDAGGPGLAEVGFLAGFSDEAHFARTFRCNVGTTPGIYRAEFGRR